jgi:hypothetical protein
MVSIGVAAFAAVAALVRTAVPWPEEGALDVRWEAYRAHATEIDLVAVGSSHIARGFDPVAFDAEMARLGHPLHSYNLGADNMQPVEADFVLRRAAAQRGTALRFAVIELLQFAPRGMLRDHAFTDRALYWHDATALRAALARVSASAETPRERARLAWLHVQHFAWRFVGLGRIDRVAARWRAPADPLDLAVAAAGGFEALDDRPDAAAERVRMRFLAASASYQEGLAEVDRRNRVPTPAGTDEVAALRAQVARLRRAGIEPVYVTPPIPSPTPALRGIFAAAGDPLVVSTNAPGEFPALFAIEHRYDATHVNRAGAAVFSRLLAARLAARLADGVR